MTERLLKLPITLTELGDIAVSHGAAGDATFHARGHYDPEANCIVIDEACSPIGEVVVLIHEMMHAAECSLIKAGVFKRHVNHQFIHAASFGAALALAKSGALRGITEDDITSFMHEAINE